MKILGILTVMALAIGILKLELPIFVRNDQRQKLWVFFTFLALGCALSIAVIINPRLPTPQDFFARILGPLTDLISIVTKGD